jgi:myo-inositol-1(or 4)-monophosphatase
MHPESAFLDIFAESFIITKTTNTLRGCFQLVKKSPELSCAVRAAKSCRRIVLKNFGKTIKYKKKSAQEIVTKTDIDCEKNIKRILKKTFPGYGFIGEETDHQTHFEKNAFWIVDPLDGSTNFLHGLPSFVISICLIEKNQPTVGVIFDPVHKELFYAQKGGGTFMNNSRVSVSKTKRLEDCLIQFNAAYNHRSEVGALIKKIGDIIREPQMGRSTALQMADVCCGRSDAFIKIKPKIFDLFAGILLIREAGGKITTFKGKKFSIGYETNIVASNGKIHKKIVKKINQ